MSALKTKLTSRKFWTTIICIIVGICIMSGVSTDQINTTAQAIVSGIQTLAGTATTLVAVVAYVITEGKVDAETITAAAASMLSGSGETIAGQEDGGADDTGENIISEDAQPAAVEEEDW